MTTSSNPLALITGASSGIGATFARRLASLGYDLILTARREARLAELANECSQTHHIATEIIPANLSLDADLQRLEEKISSLARIDLLVNNAGFGQTGTFVENAIPSHLDMIQVHVIASTRLAHAALKKMLPEKKGGVINVSSVAGLLPLRNVSYGATKAYLIAFSQGLNRETAPQGVKVQALCPGFTHTEFHDRRALTNFQRSQIPRFMWSSAEKVVSASLRALKRGQVICIPGTGYKIIVFLAQFPITGALINTAARLFVPKKR